MTQVVQQKRIIIQIQKNFMENDEDNQQKKSKLWLKQSFKSVC